MGALYFWTMNYQSLHDCVQDLEENDHLIRFQGEVDPNLDLAAVQRRLYAAGAPAVLFENIKGSDFPALANLFGSDERVDFIFRKSAPIVEKLIQNRKDPLKILGTPSSWWGMLKSLTGALPKKQKSGDVLYGQTSLAALPQLKSWPDDGGAFITLPQVYSQDPAKPNWRNSNLGMYRVQISGNVYHEDEAGVHYQLHRGIGNHHQTAEKMNQPLEVSVFIGGPPAHTVAAVMPLPENIPELSFAGALAQRRFRYIKHQGHVLSADADFVITGKIYPGKTRPEGPFGDHIGYYSLRHEMPLLKVEAVYHRKDAIFPLTVVGRPPQEDTHFGNFIHRLTGSAISQEIPGVKAVHAVDVAGVHPLLLAIGSERYVPYEQKKSRELHTQAHAILGYGQLSLAKYLIVVDGEDAPELNIHDIREYFHYFLQRVDWREDIQFLPHTTIDTLDYSGTGLNEGSKTIWTACGSVRRSLAQEAPKVDLPAGFSSAGMPLSGVWVIDGPKIGDAESGFKQMLELESCLSQFELDNWPLIVVSEAGEFCADSLENLLWVTFTRSNPSHDIFGTRSETRFRHWSCKGSLIIDARIKPHHAPPLVEDPKSAERADQLVKEILG